MGIIKAISAAMRGAAADQWKEAFRAGEMSSDLLMVRAEKIAGQGGSNSVITDGSAIIVGEGECALATEGGKIIGIYDQPGEQIFRSQQSRGIFSGGLGAFMKDVGRRISFGGDVAVYQRLYYINTKELTGGTIQAEGVPLRFKDPVTGLDADGSITCRGSYTFRISNPELFFKAAIRSLDERDRKYLLKQMDSEVLTALGPALAQLTLEGIRPSQLPLHTEALCEKLRQVMSDRWSGLRGIEVFSAALESVEVLDAAMTRELQKAAVLKDPSMAAAYMTGAKGAAMQAAAANPSGMSPLAVAILQGPTVPQDKWICVCGAENSGRFCTQCGGKRPGSTPEYP